MESRLKDLCAGIKGKDASAADRARQHWDSLAKPLGSLGLLEEMVVKIAGICGSGDVSLPRRDLLVFCADNDVIRQGVSQSSSDVTTAVALSLARGQSTASYMAKEARCSVYPVNIGMHDTCLVADEQGKYLKGFCIREGTGDITEGPAMTRAECIRAIFAGIELAGQRKEAGASIVLAGEMGIGNTTTATAVSAVLLQKEPSLLTGRGAGLSDEGLKRKTEVIEKAIQTNRPDPADPIDILRKVGGLDLAGLCGLCLGGARYRVPILLDGVITLCAACCAALLCPACKDALLVSHASAEPAARWLLEELGMEAPIQAKLRLGEGTGALLALSLLDQTLALYQSGHTFSHLGIEPYKRLSEGEQECLRS
ncbi:MAG: nicotinate-nucleotide--dimethylbenzimidazole phosphoribosyltransferase [Lachnospiraceae bacterium]|nr:nicotinate-nucleotide--dimethylbenzimidazole phosphoribosyltransferase [Lachnospiraceae bacterium]